MRAARACAEAASRVSFLACVRTRRPVVFDGDVAVVERVVVRRADGLRAAGLRLAAGFLAVLVLLVLVFSAMVADSPCWVLWSKTVCSPRCKAGEHMYVNRDPD